MNEEMDATAHPNQITQNNTETPLSKILANLSDARFTDDDSSNMIYHIFIKGSLNLNPFCHVCEKFNKEFPQAKIRTVHSCSMKTLYDWLRDDNNHAFEDLTNLYFDFPDDFDTTSEYKIECALPLFI